MTVKCVVCGGYRRPRLGVTVFSFPAQPDRKNRWLRACGYEATELPPMAGVCSNHFTPEDFSSSTSQRLRLNHSAVPSLLLMQPEERHQVQATATVPEPSTTPENVLQSPIDLTPASETPMGASQMPSADQHKSKMEKIDLRGSDGSKMEWNIKGETMTIRHATDSTLAFLTGLAWPGQAWSLKELTITESPLVTASGLLHVGGLSELTKLERLILRGVPAGSITDAVLDGLKSCSELWWLQLGDPDQPQETAITAAAVIRLAVECRELYRLELHTTADISKDVLDGLHRTDLGSRSDGRPRTIMLGVPGPVYSQLTMPPSGSRISVYRWW